MNGNIFLQLRLFDSVGIESNLTHLPIPISFKRRYSNDDEAAGVDNGEKNAEILDQNDQIIVQVYLLYYQDYFWAITLHL